ncbi:MAG: hypothetical protein OEL83_07510 [Desulforhopalus sp.]|nr:hypothetical protein [Desulforhopalus sp.]
MAEYHGGNPLQEKQQTNPETHRHPNPEKNLYSSMEAVVESRHLLISTGFNRPVRRILRRQEENQIIYQNHNIANLDF